MSKAIRKELSKLIKEKHKTCTTDKQRNKAVNEARQEINEKYGHGWNWIGASVGAWSPSRAKI